MKLLVILVVSVVLCSAAPKSGNFRPSPLRTSVELKPSDRFLSSAYVNFLDQFVPLSEIKTEEYDWPSLIHQAKQFQEFTEKYNKSYSGYSECQYRFKVFQQRLKEIEEKNSKLNYPVHGINPFADLTFEEFKSRLGFKPPKADSADLCTPQSNVPDVEVPDSLDYTEKGLVTPVKNQGQCGSCWSFSAVGNIEGQYAKKYSKLVDISEEQLVDCSGTGCGGWFMNEALSLVMNQGGIETLADYPYTADSGWAGTCQFNKNKVKAVLSGCEDWKVNANEDALKKVLVSRAPLSVAVAADSLLTYSGGVLNGGDCSLSNELNHGVLLTGYGYDKTQQMPYWTVKNSWSADFGEKGYFRMQYGVNCLNMVGEGAMIANAVVA